MQKVFIINYLQINNNLIEISIKNNIVQLYKSLKVAYKARIKEENKRVLLIKRNLRRNIGLF